MSFGINMSVEATNSPAPDPEPEATNPLEQVSWCIIQKASWNFQPLMLATKKASSTTSPRKQPRALQRLTAGYSCTLWVPSLAQHTWLPSIKALISKTNIRSMGSEK